MTISLSSITTTELQIYEYMPDTRGDQYTINFIVINCTADTKSSKISIENIWITKYTFVASTF